MVRHFVANEREVLPIKFFDGSLTLQENIVNLEKQFAAIDCSRVEALVHCAWVDVKNWESNAHLEINLPLSQALIELAVAAGIRRFNVIGTCLEYGDQSTDLEETNLTFPTVNYAISKSALLDFLSSTSKREIEFNWFRVFYLTGSEQLSNTLYGALQKSITAKEPAFEVGNPSLELDYLPISKATEYISRIIYLDRPIGLVNICSGVGKPLHEHVEKWADQISRQQNCPRTIKIVQGKRPIKPGQPQRVVGSARKLRSVLK